MKIICDKIALWCCCFLCIQLSTSSVIPENATSNNQTLRRLSNISANSSDIVNPTLKRTTIQNFTTDDVKCLSERSFLINGSCHHLYTQGPCLEGEWLVLDRNGDYSQLEKQIRPICKINPCEIGYIWWTDRNKCEERFTILPLYCQKNMMITIEPFGEGSCICLFDFGMFENGSQCFEYYQQGPCKSSEVVTYDKVSGYAVCTEDKCLLENVIHNMNVNMTVNDVRRKIYAPMEGNGTCYKLFSSDSCMTKEFSFVIDRVSNVPKCRKVFEFRFALDVGDRCSTAGNKCRETVNVRQKAIKYTEDLNRLSRKAQNKLTRRSPK